MKPFRRIKLKGLGNRATLSSLRFSLILVLTVFCYIALVVSPVFAVPTIVSSPLPTGQVNASYITTLTAVPISPPATWSIISGALPIGLSLNPGTGTISGIPTTSGTFTIIVQVTDTTGTSSPASFYITINPPPFNITTTSLPSGLEGTAYSTSLAATGGTTPYYWSISNGTLPSGVLLSTTTGYISGVPKAGSAGSYSFTVLVTDNSVPQRSTQTTLSIYIEQGTFQPTVVIGAGLEAGSTKIKVDNKTVGTLKGGETLSFALDLGASSTVTVDSIVQDPNNDSIRYKAREDSQVVNELQSYVTFDYTTEYKIDIVTSPAQITTISGSGWYGKDDTMNVSAKAEVQQDAYNSYRFSHWLLPDNNTINTETLNFIVTSPGILAAYYDTYYKLTINSQFGETEGEGWYKSGTEATWSVVKDEVPMSGLMGFFQGKYKAVNPNGTEIMDAPKTVTVIWEADYLLPYILIPTIILVVILAIVGFYFLLRRPQPKPVAFPQQMAPSPMAPRPIPQQHTTVVMIESKGKEQKQLPSTTKDQLIEKFAELLDKYETEIRTTIGPGETAKIQAPMEKMIPSPPPPLDVVEAEVVKEEEGEITCGATTKKLLRTVAGKWRQLGSHTVTLPPSDKDSAERTGLAVTWARDLYHEWEIMTCTLPNNHKGKHRGDSKIIYTVLNTINIKQTYDQNQAVQPPSPHFTDSMPEVEPEDEKIISAAELPLENLP